MNAATKVLDRVFMPAAPAERLGMVRAWVGAYAFIYLCIRAPHLTSFAWMDALYFRPVGLATLLPGPLPSALVVGLVVLTLPFALAFALGWHYRITAPIFAVLQLWILTYSNSFGMILHVDNLMCLQVLVLAISPAAEAVSLDARDGRVTAVQGEQGRYGWALRLICIVTVCAYLLAAIAKIKNSGAGFVSDVNLRNYIAYDNVRKIELGSFYSPLGVAMLPYAGFFEVMAWFSLLLEALAPLALFHRRIGAVWAVLIWGFHVGVLALMAIGFVYPLSFIAFAAFFRTEKMLDWRFIRWIGARFAKDSPGLATPEA